jgi:flagellar assembly protein FliH
MAYAKILAFDRPLAGATVPGRPSRLLTETEAESRAQAAYRAGVDTARAAADQQMVEFRADMAQLSDTVLGRLAGLDQQLLAQLRTALPGLAVELARRLLAGYEPPPEMVAKLCQETLEQLFPERDGLELSLCPRDAELFSRLNPEWLQRYPGLRIRTDALLAPGDCQVRSRFGLTDARQETKLTVLAHHLTGGGA